VILEDLFMNSKNAIVLLSGGQDSTTCLFWALQRFKKAIALNIQYGQRHKAECLAAEKIAHIAGIPLFECHIENVFPKTGSALTDSSKDISSNHERAQNLPASFVPGRNILFLTVAAAYAYKEDIQHIITGVCQTDYSGYPDCRDATIKATQMALSLGLEKDIVIHTPLMWLTKADTVRLAADLGDNCMEALSYSHTCYEGFFPPCDECPACKIRAKGFAEAGIEDPLIERAKSVVPSTKISKKE
jgi:7-cyano-7-deazaguanine synthase